MCLVAAILAAVGVATLTPSSGGVEMPSFWCIACGELGGLDVIANVVMFVPLGLTIALATGRGGVAILLCVLATLAIELLQIGVVPGRDASVSDLLANTLGGIFGAMLATGWHALVYPRARVAHRLAIGWAVAILGILSVTSWGLGPAPVPRSLWIQRTPSRPSYEPFTGKLLAFDVEGVKLDETFPDGSIRLDRYIARDTWTASAVIDTRGLQPRRSIIVRIAEEFTVLMWMDQVGWNLTCLQKTRSALLRLRSPKVALVNGLRAPAGAADSAAFAHLSCSRRHGALDAGVAYGAEVRGYRLPLTPSLGWLLLSPFDLAFDARYRVVSALWLVCLLVPAGFWSWAAYARPASPRRSRALGSAGIAATAVATIIGLVVAPRVFDVATGAWWEWAACIAGAVIGIVLQAHLLRFAPEDRIRP
jgi:hypothetical protein